MRSDLKMLHPNRSGTATTVKFRPKGNGIVGVIWRASRDYWLIGPPLLDRLAKEHHSSRVGTVAGRACRAETIGASKSANITFTLGQLVR